VGYTGGSFGKWMNSERQVFEGNQHLARVNVTLLDARQSCLGKSFTERTLEIGKHHERYGGVCRPFRGRT
jgi:hypothetical protein